MTPENGKFVYITHLTLTTSDTVIPVGTTHIICGLNSGTLTDEYGFLAIKFDGTTLNKILVPFGEFIAIGNIVPGVTDVLISTGAAPASTVVGVSCFRWEQS